MWTLSDIRSKLTDRLAEESVDYWTSEGRISYINEGQRLVSAITRGVTSTVTQAVDPDTTQIALPEKVLNGASPMAYVDGGNALPVVPIENANLISPKWRIETAASPRWIILDLGNVVAYPHPIPDTEKTIHLTVSVLPNDLVDDADLLFNGLSTMEKYQGVVLNFASSLALLKQRYDGDAERFYQMGVAELERLGINPHEIPPFHTVRSNNA